MYEFDPSTGCYYYEDARTHVRYLYDPRFGQWVSQPAGRRQLPTWHMGSGVAAVIILCCLGMTSLGLVHMAAIGRQQEAVDREKATVTYRQAIREALGRLNPEESRDVDRRLALQGTTREECLDAVASFTVLDVLGRQLQEVLQAQGPGGTAAAAQLRRARYQCLE